MKRIVFNGKRVLVLIAVLSLVAFALNVAVAADTAPAAKDQSKLSTAITMLNNDAKSPSGETAVTDRLSKSFNVKSDEIKSLRDKGMSYGEIATALVIADKMTGGVKDQNINKVAGLHKPGQDDWGQIAQSLKVDFSKIANKVASVEKDAHKDVMKAASKGPSTGSAGGGTHSDKGGKSGRGTTGKSGGSY